MSEEFSCIKLLIPDTQLLSDTPCEPLSNSVSESVNYPSPQVGQYVQFIKSNFNSMGKISFKETMGKIINLSDNYVEVVDCLGDVVQISTYSIKILSPLSHDIEYFCLPSAV